MWCDNIVDIIGGLVDTFGPMKQMKNVTKSVERESVRNIFDTVFN